MLTLVTGTPGTGKSLRMMSIMRDEYVRNQAAVKEGKEQPRNFYSNIKGSFLGDEVDPNPNAFDWVKPLPPDNDWTKLPRGSFVMFDEAHSDGITPGLERYGRLFPSTGRPGESDDPRIRALSTHRSSFSMDIVMGTQFPTKLHHNVRQQVGQHIHHTRAMGLEAAGSLTWARAQPDPYDEKIRERAEEEVWNFPKDLYGRYISATLHTRAHKFKLPKKVKNGLITGATMLLMLAGFWWWMGWDLGVFFGGGGQPQAKASAASPAAAPSFFNPSTDTTTNMPQGTGSFTSLNTEPAPTLMGCVSSDRGCRCFNVDGFVIDMSQHQCHDVLSKPLPFNVAHKFARPQREDSRDRREERSTSGPVEPVPGFSGGDAGTAPAPTVDPSFGTVTRGNAYGS